MKNLLSCAALLCAVAIVGCSKTNKTEDNPAATDTDQNTATAIADLPAGIVIEGEQLLDSAGNVIATVVDGAYVDAKGKVIGTVEAVEAGYQAAKDKAADFASQAADSVKNVAANVKEGVENKASQVVSDAKEAGSKAVDDIKQGVAEKMNEGANALKNEASKLGK